MWVYQPGRGMPTAHARRVSAGSYAACTVVIGLLATSVHAEGPALTFGEAERIAIERSQRIAAQDLSVAAARERGAAAGALPDPVLKLGVDNLPVDGPARFSTQRDFMTMRRIGLSQEWVRSSTRQLREARGAGTVKLTEAERQVTLGSVQRATAVAWLDAHYAAAALTELEGQKKQSEGETAAVEAAYREGRGKLVDVFAARSASAEIGDGAIDATRRLRVAQSSLARWVGDSANQLLAGRPAIDEIPWHRHELAAQLDDHPDIRLAKQRSELARTDLKLAEAATKPDWTVELSYAARGEAFSNMVSVGIAVPLQVNRRDRQSREIAARRAELAQAEADREDMRREHVAEIDALLAQWDSDRARRDRYQTDIVPLAAHRSEAALAAYRGGRGTLADVLAARRNEIDVHLKALEVEASAARAWALLTYLVPAPSNPPSTREPSEESLP